MRASGLGQNVDTNRWRFWKFWKHLKYSNYPRDLKYSRVRTQIQSFMILLPETIQVSDVFQYIHVISYPRVYGSFGISSTFCERRNGGSLLVHRRKECFVNGSFESLGKWWMGFEQAVWQSYGSSGSFR